MSAMVSLSSAIHSCFARCASRIDRQLDHGLALLAPLGAALLRLLLGVAEQREIWRVDRGEQPVHPALDVGALGRCRAGHLRRIAAAKIAQDRVRLPDHGRAVNQSRHLGIRVHRLVFGCRGVVELAPVIFARVRLLDFFQQEDHLLHVSRRLAPEQSDHVAPRFCLRMILSENRFPLFGIMRCASRHSPLGKYAIASISILVLITARASTVVRASTASLKCSANTLL